MSELKQKYDIQKEIKELREWIKAAKYAAQFADSHQAYYKDIARINDATRRVFSLEAELAKHENKEGKREA